MLGEEEEITYLVAFLEVAGSFDEALCQQVVEGRLVHIAVHELDLRNHEQLNQRLQDCVPASHCCQFMLKGLVFTVACA